MRLVAGRKRLLQQSVSLDQRVRTFGDLDPRVNIPPYGILLKRPHATIEVERPRLL